MIYIKRLFATLLLFCFLSILKSQAACVSDTDCLQSIDQNTQETATNMQSVQANSTAEVIFWRDYLTRYLQLNYDPNTNQAITPYFPPTPDLRPNLFKTLQTKEQDASNHAVTDTQQIINGTLNNSISIGSYMTRDFQNIAPLNTESPENSSLNIESLLSQNTITGLNSSNTASEVGLAVKNLILLLSSAADPLPIDQNQGNKSNEEWQNHLSIRWILNAQRSMALSNFYQMMRQREIVSGLGTEAGLTNDQGEPIEDASPRQVEDFLATKRIGNPQWYSEMENASPIRIARESLYVLAEVQRLLYMSYKQDERILATTSVIVSQGVKLGEALTKMMDEIKKVSDKAQAQLQQASSDNTDYSNIDYSDIDYSDYMP